MGFVIRRRLKRLTQRGVTTEGKLYRRRTAATVWTPRRGERLTGWWGATQRLIFPLTISSMGLRYQTYLPHNRVPYLRQWVRLARRRHPRGHPPGWVAKVAHQVSRRQRERRPGLIARGYQTTWLTTLTTLLPPRVRAAGTPLLLTSTPRWSTLLTNRRTRWATQWQANPRLLFPPVKSSFSRQVNTRLTYRLPSKVVPNSVTYRCLPRAPVPVVRSAYAIWWAKCSMVRFNFYFSHYLYHRARFVKRYASARPRFTLPNGYLPLSPTPFAIPSRRDWLPRRRGRSRRRRRWYPGDMFWLFREYAGRILPRPRLPTGYLGLTIAPAQPHWSKTRWWWRRDHPRRWIRPASQLASLVMWAPPIWRRRRRRRIHWRHRKVHRAYRHGNRHRYPQQQRWSITFTPWPTAVRRLASAYVIGGRRWTTERVTRRLSRTINWKHFYCTGYTSVGYRTRVKGGATVKVPTLLPAAKSLVFFRRWWRRTVTTHNERQWQARVVGVVVRPAGLLKQQNEFISAALANAALL